MTNDNEKSEQIRQAVDSALELLGTETEELIPILSQVNKDLGFLPVEALDNISQRMKIPSSQVLSVASFYHMLYTKPMGRHVVKFCESAPCHVTGGRIVWSALKEELKLNPGETSPDGKWTLITVSCLGICAVGPVMMVDEDVYGNITPNQISSILTHYQ